MIILKDLPNIEPYLKEDPRLVEILQKYANDFETTEELGKFLLNNSLNFTPELKEDLLDRMMGGDMMADGEQPNLYLRLKALMYEIWEKVLGNEPIQLTSKNQQWPY